MLLGVRRAAHIMMQKLLIEDAPHTVSMESIHFTFLGFKTMRGWRKRERRERVGPRDREREGEKCHGRHKEETKAQRARRT